MLNKYWPSPTWSIAHGIRQGIFKFPLNGIENVLGNAGAACTAGNALLPMLSDIVKPKIALDCWNRVEQSVIGRIIRNWEIYDKLML